MNKVIFEGKVLGAYVDGDRTIYQLCGEEVVVEVIDFKFAEVRFSIDDIVFVCGSLCSNDSHETCIKANFFSKEGVAV